MRILLAHDDEAIEAMLRSAHFNVYGIDSAEEAIELGKLYNYDLILLGALDWKAVIRSLRNAKIPTPIIVLSIENRAEEAVLALGLGADDFVRMPFHEDELVSRIRAVVRRSKGHPRSLLSIDNFELDLDAGTASVSGAPLRLTNKEYQIAQLLALRPGVVHSKEAILNDLYGGHDEPELKIIDVFLCKLRKKLRDAGAADLIETVWGRGYTIAKPEDRTMNLQPAE